MIFHNLSSVPVRIDFGSEEWLLQSGEIRKREAVGEVRFIIRHTYRSSAAPLKQIEENISCNTAAEMLQSIGKPSFSIVLDGYHILANVSENTVIQIHRERLYPCPLCQYDRLAPLIGGGFAISEKYEFEEKEEYTRLRSKALWNGNLLRKIAFFLLLFVLAAGAIGWFLLPSGGWMRTIGVISFISTLIAAIVFYVVCVILSAIECNMPIREFESEKILQYFQKDACSAHPGVVID